MAIQITTMLTQEVSAPVNITYLLGNVFSQDSRANWIGVQLFQNGVPYSGGGTVSANVILANGTYFAVAGSLNHNLAAVILPAAAYSVPGPITIVIKLSDSDIVTTIAAIVSSVYQTSTSTPVDVGTIMPSIQSLIDRINTAVATIPDNYAELSEKVNAVVTDRASMSDNLLNQATITMGKYLNGNTEYDNASYCYTDFIPVTPGVTYSFQTQTNSSFASRTNKSMRFICEYDANKGYKSTLVDSSTDGYTPGSGIYYIRASMQASYITDASITLPAIVTGTTIKEYVPYEGAEGQYMIKPSALPDARSIPKGYSHQFSLNNNTYTGPEELEDLQDSVIIFRGEFSGTFPGVTVGRGASSNYGGRVEITSTTVTAYRGTSSEALNAQHGLTLKTYVLLTVKANNNNTADLTITTDGGSYTAKGISWATRIGHLTAATTGTLSNCSLAYYCTDYDGPTQIYGDSYISSADPARWTTYLNNAGYGGFLLNGFPGRNSTQALSELKRIINVSNPRRIIWAMGMNDSDTSSAPNASWLACVDELVEICDGRSIELILATIPRVASVENSYKNNYVRNSGYRYIDFASAVGASNDATWYAGMLDDGIHPTAAGAVALYTQALADVPELATPAIRGRIEIDVATVSEADAYLGN